MQVSAPSSTTAAYLPVGSYASWVVMPLFPVTGGAGSVTSSSPLLYETGIGEAALLMVQRAGSRASVMMSWAVQSGSKATRPQAAAANAITVAQPNLIPAKIVPHADPLLHWNSTSVSTSCSPGLPWNCSHSGRSSRSALMMRYRLGSLAAGTASRIVSSIDSRSVGSPASSRTTSNRFVGSSGVY